MREKNSVRNIKPAPRQQYSIVRVLVAVLIIIGLGVLLYFYIGRTNQHNKAEKNYNENVLTVDMVLYYLDADFDKLAHKVVELQRSADQITRFNALITQILYARDLSEGQIRDLMDLQRMSYGEELLAKNPYEIQLERLLEDLELYKEFGNEGLKVLGYELNGPEFDTVDGNEYAFVNVVYYLSLMNLVKDGENGDEGNLYLSYVLEENEDGLWYIKGWGTVDEFLIVN